MNVVILKNKFDRILSKIILSLADRAKNFKLISQCVILKVILLGNIKLDEFDYL